MATVIISAGSSIQNSIDVNPAGTTFLLDSGTWHQQQIAPKANDSFIGAADGGTVLTGDDVTSYLANNGGGILGTGVVLQNITIEHYVPGFSQGAVNGVVGWTLNNDTFQFMGNSGDGVVPGHDTIISGGHYLYNAGSGIDGYLSNNVVIQGAEIAYNNTANLGTSDNVAGVKLNASSNVQILNNYVHDNNADGIWADGHSTNWVIDGNTILNNANNGISWETSDGVTIRNNTITSLNVNSSGILIASSGDAEAYNNNVTVPDQAFGILWVTQDRGDQVTGQNIYVHDNTVSFLGPIGYNGWFNFGGSVGAGNNFSNNQYHDAPGGENIWVWTQVYTDDFYNYVAASGSDYGSTIDYLLS